MEPAPSNDVRTIWFATNRKPRATTDFEQLLERDFDQLVSRSIRKFPNLWTPEEYEAKKSTKHIRNDPITYLSSKLKDGGEQKDDTVAGHYCVVKPFPPRVQEFMHDIFEPYGQIVEKKIAKSTKDGVTMGVVDFYNKHEAERAARSLDGAEVDGIVMAARYMEKKKRPKTLDLIAHRQAHVPPERNNRKQLLLQQQWAAQSKLSAAEIDLLTELSQQWAYYSEINGSVPLDAVTWSISSNKHSCTTIVHKPEATTVRYDKAVEETMSELVKDTTNQQVNRKLRY